MKFALVNDIRAEPSPGNRGICCYCGVSTTSRCGPKRVWHWAHLPNKHCDPWWESETLWHRKWKGYFLERNQEVIHFDSLTGEKHIADIKTDRGLVIELQNSPIKSTELHSRENFYENMVWIVNGEKFKDNFHILDPLPDPRAEFAQDIVFSRRCADWQGRVFWRLSENPDYIFGSSELVRLHSMSEIENQIKEAYIGHHLFDWKHPRTVWYESNKPVYLDFNSNELLVQVKIYRLYGDHHPLWCVQYVSKKYIIETAGGIYTSIVNTG